MKSRRPVFCAVLFLALIYGLILQENQATASPYIAEKGSITIEPQTSLPSFIVSRMPPQAKNRFFGAAQLPTLGREKLCVHFYEFLPKGAVIPTDPTGRQWNGVKTYIVNIYKQGDEKKPLIHLINSIKLDTRYFDHEVYAFDAIQASVMWLVPAKHQVPVIKLDCIVTEGFYGQFGEEILIVFDKGMDRQPVTQGFYWYGDHMSAEGFRFNKVDDCGFMTVTKLRSEGPEGGDVPTDLRWNGKEFVPPNVKK